MKFNLEYSPEAKIEELENKNEHLVPFSSPLATSSPSHCSNESGNSNSSNSSVIEETLRSPSICPTLKKRQVADECQKVVVELDGGQWPELEKELQQWVEDQRKSGYIVTRNLLRLHAKVMAKRHNIANFCASDDWCTNFLKRHDFVIRQKTKISQKLPVDWEEKIVSFHSYVIKKRKQKNFDLSAIGNMDETPVWFDMPAVRTVESRGAKTVFVKTTSHEKTRFTVVLACLADGTKLKPMVVFKRKTMPKERFPSGVVIHVHSRGWMDKEGVKIWIEKVWRCRAGSLNKPQSLLVWDSFSAHLVDSAKRELRENNTTTAVIPGGLTSVVQPLDVCLNKPFKDRVREKWCTWMIEGEKTFTAGGNVRAAPLSTICEWVKDSWNEIPSEMVARSFKNAASQMRWMERRMTSCGRAIMMTAIAEKNRWNQTSTMTS